MDDGRMYTTRSFCILETYATVYAGRTLQVRDPHDQCECTLSPLGPLTSTPSLLKVLLEDTTPLSTPNREVLPDWPKEGIELRWRKAP